jgi:hypothetical protein
MHDDTNGFFLGNGGYVSHKGEKPIQMEILIFWFLLAYLAVMLPKYLRYKKSSYKEASGNGFLRTVHNKGNYGEFLTFAKLEKLDGNNKLLTNRYLPKQEREKRVKRLKV